MIKTYKYQLDLNNKQKEYFAKSFGCARWVYNHGLNRRITAYQTEGKRLNAIDLCKELTHWKKEEDKLWLNEVANESLQQSLRNMDTAFTKFFREKKGFPKYKSKFSKQSCKFINSVQVNFKISKIRIPKIGWLNFFCDRTFEGKIGTVTVSKNAAGKYFVSVLVDNGVELPIKLPIEEKTSIGIDVGIKDFATLSTEEKIANPKYLENTQKRLSCLQRRLSRKKKGSKRRERAKLTVAKYHYKITCKRSDFLHKLTSQLIAENQSIIIEDLNIAGMLKNNNLARSISSASWSEFYRQLEYKCLWSGKNLIRIGRFEPSSKMCTCGEVNKELKLSDRIWTCSKCNATHDRDILAANNIKRFGLQKQNLTGEVIAEEDVEVRNIRPKKRQDKKV